MRTEPDVTRVVRSWLEQGVTELPDRVLDYVLDQVPATPQRRPLWSARRYLDMKTTFKVATAAAAVFAVAVAGVNLLPGRGEGSTAVASGAAPSSSPVPLIQGSPSVHDRFAAPFEYHLPQDGSLSLVPMVPPTRTFAMVGFLEGPVTEPPAAFPDTESYGTHQGPDGAPRGIVVMRVSGAATHSCPSGPDTPIRPELGDSPAEILEGLRTTAGAGIASEPSVVIDGRPALVATVMPTEHLCEGTDIHTAYGDWVSLEHPSRLIVLQVDEVTILIDIWARSDEDLADWMPRAMQFVETIHFR